MMTDLQRQQRKIRQHLVTEQLLGVEAVPVGEPAPVDAMGGVDPSTRDATTPATDSLDRSTRLQLLTDMDQHEVRNCTKCELHHGRTNTVFGEGDAESALMFIGEGPGRNEDEQGRPFVGRAGDLLDKMIVAMGLQREQVYIANVVKCRPPDNRTPTPIEVEKCYDYLKRQIRIIAPRVIVTLGGPAVKKVLGTTTGITALRGTWHQYTGLQPDGPVIPVMPTFHPAYLLRSYTKENRHRVWSDLQQAMTKLGLKD